MGAQPPPLQQQKQQSQEAQQQSESTAQQAPPVSDAPAAPEVEEQAARGKKSGFKAGETKATAGRTGERNLAIQWIDVPLGYAFSARFNIRTAAANALEVVIEQRGYHKTLKGTGTVATQILPVAPIGTLGKLVARDTVTGETLEQPWRWHQVGGFGGGLNIWDAIKRLLWKGDK